jgi:tetratricopeptide (TPR) repeat protein
MKTQDRLTHEVELAEAAAQRAREHLTEASRLAENAGDFRFKLGLAAYLLKDYATACDELERSFDLLPSADGAARLAMSWFRAGNLTDAEKWIRVAIKLEPSGILRAHVLGTDTAYLSMLATIQLSLGDVKKAVDTAEAALRVNSSEHLAHQVLARAALLKGDEKVSADSDFLKGAGMVTFASDVSPAAVAVVSAAHEGDPRTLPIDFLVKFMI